MVKGGHKKDVSEHFEIFGRDSAAATYMKEKFGRKKTIAILGLGKPRAERPRAREVPRGIYRYNICI